MRFDSPEGAAPWVLLNKDKWLSTSVPVCRNCHFRVVWGRRIRFTLLLLAIGIVISIVGPFFDDLVQRSPFFGRIARFLVGLALLAPVFFLNLRYTLPFDLSAVGEEIVYDFANSSYAEEFALLNGNSIYQL